MPTAHPVCSDEFPPPPGTTGRGPDGGPSPFPAIPGYAILRELGRGGMGVVYHALDTCLNRPVAIKMVPAGPVARPELAARFRAEAETVAQLQHPNIVQVYEVGECGGLPYFVQEYLAGGTLADRLNGKPLPPLAAAGLAETLARAVAHAHARGIVHRDLKPANVLLQARGSPSVGLDTPKIADFGLAKRVGAEPGRTQTGAVVGTPQYMAPEQAAGRTAEVGAAADVYALGAILYEMLTGRPPFLGASSMDTVLSVLNEEPPQPRVLNPRVPRDLETICLKCLQKAPQRRYASALELAEDLARFAAGLPVRARPVGRLERGWRWCRRNPLAAGLAAAFLASLLAGTVVSGYLAVESARRADRAEKMRQAADRHLYLARIREALHAWQEGRVVRSLELLDATRPENTSGEDLRGFEWYYLWRLSHEHDRAVIRGHTGAVQALCHSPDGRVLASASSDGQVRLWNGRTGAHLADLPTDGSPVYTLAFSPDGKRVVAGGARGHLALWDVERRALLTARQASDPAALRVTFTPSGDTVLFGIGGSIGRWSLGDYSLSLPKALRPEGSSVCSLTFAGQELVVGDNRGRLHFWENGLGPSATIEAHSSYVPTLAATADGRRLASASLDGTVKVWDLPERRERAAFRGLPSETNCLTLRPDGRYLITAGNSGAIHIRDLEADGGKAVRQLAHTCPVLCLSLAADGKTLAVAGVDGTIKLLDAQPHPSPGPGRLNPIGALAFRPDGLAVASAGGKEGAEETVTVWDVETQQLQMTCEGGPDVIWSLAWSPGGDLLAAGGKGGTWKLWDARTGKRIAQVLGHKHDVWGVAFSPDGRLLATAGYNDQTVGLWDVETRKEVHRWTCEADRVWSVAFSPDGQWVAAGQSKGLVTVWDVATKEKRLELSHPEIRHTDEWVWAVAFSPDSRTLAAGLVDGSIVLWDPEAGRRKQSLRGHPVFVRALAFFPDGTTLMSGGDDGTLRLWDLRTCEERATLRAPEGTVRALAISPDGRTVVSGGSGRRLHFWRAASPNEAARAD